MQSDWDASAEAWIESLKTGGDFSRVAVLDRPMSVSYTHLTLPTILLV